MFLELHYYIPFYNYYTQLNINISKSNSECSLWSIMGKEAKGKCSFRSIGMLKRCNIYSFLHEIFFRKYKEKPKSLIYLEK